MFRLKKLFSLAISLVLAAGFATTAHATYPGKNGRIAFGEGPDIWTMNPDGSDLRNLTSFGPNGESACCASWSADGKRLLFVHFASSTSPAQVWMMNSDGSNRHQVLNDPSFFDSFPGFSPDGTTIVFERCPFSNGQLTGGCELFRMRSDGAGLKALIPFGPNTDIFDVTPEYSPDGKTIAFAGFNRAGLIAAVYLMNADGSNIRPVSPPGLEAWLPDWSPDGNSLAFSTRVSYPPNTLTPQVWIMNIDGSGLRQFTFPGASNDFWPTWSPDGDAIAFERDNADFSQSAIFVKDLAVGASGETLLHSGPGTGVVFHSQSSITGMKRRAPVSGLAAKPILEKGSLPRWGPAPQ